MVSPNSVIALGTAGGPVANPLRAQPAHVVMNGDAPILIDCGEGAMGRSKGAGIEYRDVHHLFLTHHHFDHIGSLFACLGLNMMTQRQKPLTIYGPPGTKKSSMRLALLATCRKKSALAYRAKFCRIPRISCRLLKSSLAI